MILTSAGLLTEDIRTTDSWQFWAGWVVGLKRRRLLAHFEQVSVKYFSAAHLFMKTLSNIPFQGYLVRNGLTLSCLY